MGRQLSALGAGLVFGLGLGVSQMVNPAKVLGFLDVAGNWDPSLAFVMGGAVAVPALGNAFARARPAPPSAPSFQWPASRQLDPRLAAARRRSRPAKAVFVAGAAVGI